MPREVTYKGVNQQGNSYTQYSDGSYAYKNVTPRRSTYFNTGNGHAFFKSETGISFHENKNKGFRNYTFKPKSLK